MEFFDIEIEFFNMLKRGYYSSNQLGEIVYRKDNMLNSIII